MVEAFLILASIWVTSALVILIIQVLFEDLRGE